MKFFTRRRLIIFILIILLPIFYINPSNNDEFFHNFSDNEKIENLSDSLNNLKESNIPQICSNINDVNRISNERIEIMFKQATNQKDLFNFVFETKYLDEILLFDYKSFYNITFNKISISFDIILPFITDYEGKLHCLSDDFHKISYRKIDDFKRRKKYFSSQKLVLSKQEFSNSHLTASEMQENNEFVPSEMKCFGETFDDRFCYSKNIFLINENFIFNSNAIYNFPKDFVLLAPRNNTNQTFTDRLSYSPIVSNKIKFSTNDIMKLQIKDNFVYVHSYYENNLLQNVMYLYEFLFPTYQTIQIIEENPINSFDREFFVLNKNSYYAPYYNVFSNNKIQEISAMKEKKLFLSNVVFGMRRKWQQVDDEPYYYNYTKEDVKGLRELGINRLNISIDNITKTALFALSEFRFTNFGNFKTFPDDVQSVCSTFNIKTVKFYNTPPNNIISRAASAAFIIGQHSTSLSSVFWMKEGTTLIELVPNGFDCCTWYKDLASFSGVNYHLVMDHYDNRYFNKVIEFQKFLPDCYEDENRCQRKECYKILKKQIFLVLNDEWKSIVSDICSNNN